MHDIHDMHDMHDNIRACRNQALLMAERLFLPHHHVALHNPFFNTSFKLGILHYTSPGCFAQAQPHGCFPTAQIHIVHLLLSSIQLHNSSWLRSAGQALGLAIRGCDYELASRLSSTAPCSCGFSTQTWLELRGLSLGLRRRIIKIHYAACGLYERALYNSLDRGSTVPTS
jgi:hypothetical protein